MKKLFMVVLAMFLFVPWAHADDPFAPGGSRVMTRELTVDDLGLEFIEGDTISDCSTFSETGGGIYYDDSEGIFKKCQDNVLTDLDTGGAIVYSDIGDPTADQTISFANDEIT